jgi:hypothetical protein
MRSGSAAISASYLNCLEQDVIAGLLCRLVREPQQSLTDKGGPIRQPLGYCCRFRDLHHRRPPEHSRGGFNVRHPATAEVRGTAVPGTILRELLGSQRDCPLRSVLLGQAAEHLINR